MCQTHGASVQSAYLRIRICVLERFMGNDEVYKGKALFSVFFITGCFFFFYVFFSSAKTWILRGNLNIVNFTELDEPLIATLLVSLKGNCCFLICIFAKIKDFICQKMTYLQ